MSPAANTPLSKGLAIAVTRVAKATVTEHVEVAQPADQIVEDADRQGRPTVTKEGFAGKDSVTFQVTTTNGAETGKTEVSRTAVSPAQADRHHGRHQAVTPPQQRLGLLQRQLGSSSSSSLQFGARCPPVPAASTGTASRSASRPATGRSTPATATTAACSSTTRTWASGGGTAYASRADLATKEQQIAVAENVAASRGSSPWACAYAG